MCDDSASRHARQLHHVVGRYRLRAGVLCATAMLEACGRVQGYEAAPMPEPTPTTFVRRSLSDDGLRVFLVEQGAPPHSEGWTPRQLGIASLYFHPALEESRAEVDLAEAAEITAGVSPDVSVSADISRATQADEGKSTAWSYSLAAGLLFETGGQRNARRSRARAATLQARLQLESAAWQLASSAVQAATRASGAEEAVSDAEAERSLASEVAGLVRARYLEGRVSLADVAQSEQDVRSASLRFVQARRSRMEARLNLARSLAVPLRAVDSIAIVAPASTASCGELPLRFDSLGSLALRNRADVGAAVTGYALSEADLRLEVARQYPDLTIGPGLAWDQGVLRWFVSLGSPGILRNIHRGPIAEARARRSRQAARVERVQDSVLVSVDSSIAACQTVAREVEAASAAERSAAEAVRLTEAAYQRGETGRTEVAFARLALVRSRSVVHAARRLGQQASAALEAVRGGWVDGAPHWPDLMTRRRSGSPSRPSDP